MIERIKAKLEELRKSHEALRLQISAHDGAIQVLESLLAEELKDSTDFPA